MVLISLLVWITLIWTIQQNVPTINSYTQKARKYKNNKKTETCCQNSSYITWTVVSFCLGQILIYMVEATKTILEITLLI